MISGFDRASFDRLCTARDRAIVALSCANLLAIALFATSGRFAPPFSAAVMLALPPLIWAVENGYAQAPSPLVTAIRACWPAFAAPLAYLAEVRIVELGRNRYHDAVLAAIDDRLGLRTALSAPPGMLDELANAFYLSYYATLPIVLFLALRRGPVEAARATAALVFASLTCGVMWLAWPTGGYYPTGSPLGPTYGPISALTQSIYEMSPHFAAAFPSEHVAHVVALSAVLRAGGTGRWVWVWALGVAWSTVYGEYHFAADGVAGAIVGVAAATLAVRVAAGGRVPVAVTVDP